MQRVLTLIIRTKHSTLIRDKDQNETSNVYSRFKYSYNTLKMDSGLLRAEWDIQSVLTLNIRTRLKLDSRSLRPGC